MGHAARHSPGLDGGNALRQAGRPYLPPGPGGHLAGSTRGAPLSAERLVPWRHAAI